jgi:hypothetical protein
VDVEPTQPTQNSLGTFWGELQNTWGPSYPERQSQHRLAAPGLGWTGIVTRGQGVDQVLVWCCNQRTDLRDKDCVAKQRSLLKAHSQGATAGSGCTAQEHCYLVLWGLFGFYWVDPG